MTPSLEQQLIAKVAKRMKKKSMTTLRARRTPKVTRTNSPTVAMVHQSRASLAEENGRLRWLVGCVIEALEYADSDDGHLELILAGVVGEYRDITKGDVGL